MRRMVDGHQVRCELNGERTYDRCVGVCYLDGRDIAAEMVLMGLVRDCPAFSGGRYAKAEQAAVAAGAEIRGRYMSPGYCK